MTVGIAYALLECKTQDTYEELFRAFLDKCSSMTLYPDPRTILVDFKQAVISGIGLIMNNDVQVRGCFYYLTETIWRKIQELGLVPQYRDDEDFKLFCEKVDALTFLPIEDIPAEIMYIRDNTTPGAEDLLDYFNQTYVNGTFRRVGVPLVGLDGAAIVRMRRVPPLYPPVLWNVHQATLDSEPRTNNQCEARNNRLTNFVDYHHSFVWTMIGGMKK